MPPYGADRCCRTSALTGDELLIFAARAEMWVVGIKKDEVLPLFNILHGAHIMMMRRARQRGLHPASWKIGGGACPIGE